MSLAVDAMELACIAPIPKMIVIGSGDLDFVPLVVRLRERGIKVVCVTGRSKLAKDALPAYDQVIYVGEDPDNQPKAAELKPVANTPVSATAKKVTTKSPVVRTASPKPAVAKKAVAKKAVAKKVPVKKTVGAVTETVTVQRILAAVPNLKAGVWQPLGAVAKVLHDENLLAKNATTTKLFKKFPDHFELIPAGKPNQIRLILPLLQ